jgi:hypothetical protein
MVYLRVTNTMATCMQCTAAALVPPQAAESQAHAAASTRSHRQGIAPAS